MHFKKHTRARYLQIEDMGRIRRKTFIIRVTILTILILLLLYFSGQYLIARNIIIPLIFFVLLLAVFIQIVLRNHDFNKSGIIVASTFILIPMIAIIISIFNFPVLGLIIFKIYGLIYFVTILTLSIIPGTNGSNLYGSNPRNVKSSEIRKTITKTNTEKISGNTNKSKVNIEKKTSFDEFEKNIDLLKQSLKLQIIDEKEFLVKKNLIKEKKKNLISKKEKEKKNQEKVLNLNELLKHNLITRSEFDQKVKKIYEDSEPTLINDSINDSTTHPSK